MRARRKHSLSALLGGLLIVTTAIHVPVMALGGLSVAAPAVEQHHHHSSNRTPSPSHHTSNQCCDFCSVMCSAPPAVPGGAVVDRPQILQTGLAERIGTGLQSVEAPPHRLPFSIGPPSLQV